MNYKRLFSYSWDGESITEKLDHLDDESILKDKLKTALNLYKAIIALIKVDNSKFTINTKDIDELIADITVYSNTQFAQIYFNKQFWASLNLNIDKNEFEFIIDSKFSKLLEELDENKEVIYKAGKKADDIPFFIEYLDDMRMRITEYFLN